MSQTKLSSFYNTRKKRTDYKLLSDSGNDLKKVDRQNSLSSVSYLIDAQAIKGGQQLSEVTYETHKFKAPTVLPQLVKHHELHAKAKEPSKSKIPKPNSRLKSKKQTKVPEVNSKTADIRTSFQVKATSKVDTGTVSPVSEKSSLNLTYTIVEDTPTNSEASLVRTPKRNLSNPDVANPSSKKKKYDSTVPTVVNSSSVNDDVSTGTPNTHSSLVIKTSVRKNLFSGYESESLPKKESKDLLLSPKREESKSKLVSHEKWEEIKEKLARCDKTLQKFKEFKSNKFKITSAISPKVKEGNEEEKSVLENTPCYIKYHSLTEAGTTLTLPYKYKLLSETFRCSDTVVSMLNNRKETCTFEKLKSGVQDMTRKNFTKTHLGQIKTVYPLAYFYRIEKNSAAYINRRPGAPQYELVISPNLKTYKQEEKGDSMDKAGTSNNFVKSNAFEHMTPACLIERRNIFSSNLLNIVKMRHQEFLEKLNPPVRIPVDRITKWHPKFPVDSIPDVEPSDLPELPNQPKTNTAKDLLSKIKGTVGEKVEKALQTVAEEKATPEASPSQCGKKNSPIHHILKNISSDILQRVRARESVRIIEDMTQNPKDKKRAQMLERVPEIVRILRTYFVIERRAAVSLEDATQKIIDSYHSSLSPEDIKLHLQFIADIFPKWLTLIPIRKGLFLKIDKSKDINVLLDNMPTS